MKTINDLQAQAIARSRGLNRAAESLGMRNEPRPIGGRFRALLRRGERGQAILEMAFLMPLLLVIVMGVCYFGIAMNNYLSLQSAVTAGAVNLAENQSLATPVPNACTVATTVIQGASNLKPSQITITYPTSGSCAGGLVAGTPVTVNATYPCVLPIYGMNFTSCTLGATSTQPAAQ